MDCYSPLLVALFRISSVPDRVVFPSLTQSQGPLTNNSYQPIILRKPGLSQNKWPRKPKHAVEFLQVCASTCELADKDEMKVGCSPFCEITIRVLLQTCWCLVCVHLYSCVCVCSLFAIPDGVSIARTENISSRYHPDDRLTTSCSMPADLQ